MAKWHPGLGRTVRWPLRALRELSLYCANNEVTRSSQILKFDSQLQYFDPPRTLHRGDWSLFSKVVNLREKGADSSIQKYIWSGFPRCGVHPSFILASLCDGITRSWYSSSLGRSETVYGLCQASWYHSVPPYLGHS